MGNQPAGAQRRVGKGKEWVWRGKGKIWPMDKKIARILSPVGKNELQDQKILLMGLAGKWPDFEQLEGFLSTAVHWKTVSLLLLARRCCYSYWSSYLEASSDQTPLPFSSLIVHYFPLIPSAPPLPRKSLPHQCFQHDMFSAWTLSLPFSGQIFSQLQLSLSSSGQILIFTTQLKGTFFREGSFNICPHPGLFVRHFSSVALILIAVYLSTCVMICLMPIWVTRFQFLERRLWIFLNIWLWNFKQCLTRRHSVTICESVSEWIW